jgi:hypothetical protein
MRLAGAALILCLPTPAAAKPWDQCGGMSGDCGPYCKDNKWADTTCPTAHTCMRQDSWYWQCKPDVIVQQQVAAAAAAAAAALKAQQAAAAPVVNTTKANTTSVAAAAAAAAPTLAPSSESLAVSSLANQLLP